MAWKSPSIKIPISYGKLIINFFSYFVFNCFKFFWFIFCKFAFDYKFEVIFCCFLCVFLFRWCLSICIVLYRYNQIGKHLWNMALQHIIIGELEYGCFFHYDETFNEDKNLYQKIKVILKKILSSLLSSISCFVQKFIVSWFLCFARPCL
jgi:hypothetical protein